MSKWVGESEGNIRRLFERARQNRPSVIFIDEIDAIAARRGEIQVHDTQVNQLLSEIDGVSGQRGVLVIGATNRPDQLDPALLRGGRLSRTIVLGLPDEPGHLAILGLHTARMPTVRVDVAALARIRDRDGRRPAFAERDLTPGGRPAIRRPPATAVARFWLARPWVRPTRARRSSRARVLPVVPPGSPHARPSADAATAGDLTQSSQEDT